MLPSVQLVKLTCGLVLPPLSLDLAQASLQASGSTMHSLEMAQTLDCSLTVLREALRPLIQLTTVHLRVWSLVLTSMAQVKMSLVGLTTSELREELLSTPQTSLLRLLHTQVIRTQFSYFPLMVQVA